MSSVGAMLRDYSPATSGSSLSKGLAPLPSVAASTCVEPDHRELIHSVGTVLHRRVRDNEECDEKMILPLFCEDTHTEPEPEDRYEVALPPIHLQMLR
jgi:hypothetical protein